MAFCCVVAEWQAWPILVTHNAYKCHHQVWAYFCIKPMTTYKSVFTRIRKYEYDGVLCNNMQKYVKVCLKSMF